MLTDAQVAEIEARLKAATPGRWIGVPLCPLEGNQDRVIALDESAFILEEDEELIAHAPTDLVALLADWQAMRKVVGLVKGFNFGCLCHLTKPDKCGYCLLKDALAACAPVEASR